MAYRKRFITTVYREDDLKELKRNALSMGFTDEDSVHLVFEAKDCDTMVVEEVFDSENRRIRCVALRATMAFDAMESMVDCMP